MLLSAQDVALLLLLVALLATGWWREAERARRGETALPPALRGLLLVVAVGGGLGAAVWFVLLPDTFPWRLPPLASRFLSAASAAFAAGSTLALWRGRWPEARLLLTITAAYFVPLLLAVLFDLARFDLARPITWGFFLAAVGMFAIALWQFGQGSAHPAIPPASAPPEPGVRALALVVSILAALLGLVLLLAPAAALAIWPWTWQVNDSALDVLTMRLVAAMFIGLAAGGWAMLRANRTDVAEVYLLILAAYALVAGLGVLLFVLSRPATPGMLVYLVALAGVLVGAAGGLWRYRAAR